MLDKTPVTLSPQQHLILIALRNHRAGRSSGVFGLEILDIINGIDENTHSSKVKPRMSIGSLYPVLQILQDLGYVEGKWADDENSEQKSLGARRKYFTITDKGNAAYEMYQKQLEEVKQRARDYHKLPSKKAQKRRNPSPKEEPT